ncbi:hypothetical protein IWX76_002881 [Pedobacter sp. CAN_A7]
MQINDPNRILAVQIVEKLCEDLLIPTSSKDQIQALIAEGKMNERYWIGAFEKKIDLATAEYDETENY